ncbi:MAG: hypothetical protein COU81_00270 [Candidatus Portnoybacteria bacterium CG10_big_fil_rev_8_21_14_0_10_36_7]|uniref:Uncharacterized protein n=1 Tax=Candidatus Portnoybacteria bacterium CG10_big_fil_rev_8_21_14_0_10_36_7 TaxID=1974812 RepID=A0A2M8KF30_9BACT|nr:MAG: hypothetical protein COU81_00270 [Candidatus Portnoybacteria bacterium CG10_big_fil_rev_8_21_14_0_10_36_7]
MSKEFIITVIIVIVIGITAITSIWLINKTTPCEIKNIDDQTESIDGAYTNDGDTINNINSQLEIIDTANIDQELKEIDTNIEKY